MNHNSEAKVREEKKEQFQVHALINTDREEMGSVPDRVPWDGNFSVPHCRLCVGVGKQFSCWHKRRELCAALWHLGWQA